MLKLYVLSVGIETDYLIIERAYAITFVTRSHLLTMGKACES